MRILILVLLGLIFTQLKAQDTIVLTTGKMIADIEIMEIGSDFVLYQKWKKDKIKEKVVDKYSVYSIHYQNGTNVVLYKRDSLQGFMPNAQQMQSYVEGEMLARDNYQNKSATIGGVIVGAGSAATSFVGVHPFYTIIIPAAYSAILAAWEPNVDKSVVFTEEQKKDFYFMEGYRDYARMKKVKNAALSSYGSYLATLGIVAIIVSF